ncbi:H(+)-transporting V1 sector ATPase subunit F [Bacidia gigantensis]|uniref:H(+)-transporting V1 sector ATPase subunit F n=1 Tax=Bacidia gigantensis TaxID=2732470 RepID=UPI001D051FCF|nr:H(+)-transporting V1 sector ATPase subunit F [Bacidia gigantensis]KAG8531651.1 H(+)-transporting V1 sector ATPase subunit F [Bacidia gigantensis]
MAAPPSAYKDRHLLAVIGDEDSVTGLLLAGIGHVNSPPDAQKNFLVVDAKTETSIIEQTFDTFTQKRKDIAILLINQHVYLPTPIKAWPHRVRRRPSGKTGTPATK